MVCEKHRWTKKSLPCPYLCCPNGARGLWVVVGKHKKVVYVRRRTKDERGPNFDWEKTDLDLTKLTQSSPDDQDEGITV